MFLHNFRRSTDPDDAGTFRSRMVDVADGHAPFGYRNIDPLQNLTSSQHCQIFAHKTIQFSDSTRTEIKVQNAHGNPIMNLLADLD